VSKALLEYCTHERVLASKRQGEGGIALVAVLWTLMLLSVITASLMYETQTTARAARNLVENAKARAAADAGVQRSILDLLNQLMMTGYKTAFPSDGTEYMWRFADSAVRITVHDEASKVDLNRAPEDVIAAYFGSKGISVDRAKSLAAAIADFRDSDDFPRLGGAEQADYQAAGLAWGPKNAPFEGVEELSEVLGMTPEIYDLVSPNLTIYSNPKWSSTAADDQNKTLPPREIAFSIRAEAEGPNGAIFVREAVAQFFKNSPIPVIVLAWR
jgi:general secretion pathway protein K